VDRGVGFDPEVPVNRGLGIISMRERLNLVAGQIRIESRPGAGTAVRVRVPRRVASNINTPQALA
jgi:signal transduction histidine kinase